MGWVSLLWALANAATRWHLIGSRGHDLTKFVAAKKVGAVLRSPRSLTWHQATLVLERLTGDIGHGIDDALLGAVQVLFETPARLAPLREGSPDTHPDHPDRGPVYHSRRVLFALEGFEIVLGVSFTICVRMGVPLLDGPVRPSQSKFWCSAIVHGDRPDDIEENDERLATICAKVDEVAPEIQKTLLPLYERAVHSINPSVGKISETRDRFSNLVFQIQDDNFRRNLSRIEQGEKLSEMPSDSALGILNHFFSGESAATYLHVGRKHRAKGRVPKNVEIDTLVQNTRSRAQALVIETRRTNKENVANWRRLGATSASEPVNLDPERADDLVYQLLHSPANSVSSQMAAEIGKLF